jgi:hypothetical protein
MQRKEVQVVFGQNGLAPMPEARAHLRAHRSRQSFVADLRSIVSAARELPAEVDPPPRVWASLHAQLEKEGILTRSVRVHFPQAARWQSVRKMAKPLKPSCKQRTASCTG